MATDNLELPEIAQGQASKEVTHNDALIQLDGYLTEVHLVDVDTGNVVLTSEEVQNHAVFSIENATVAGRIVDIPDVQSTPVFFSVAANTQRVTLRRGTATRTIYPGELVRFWNPPAANTLREVSNNRVAMNAFHLGLLPTNKTIAAWEITQDIFWKSVVSSPTMAHLLRPRSTIAKAVGPNVVIDVEVNGVGVVEFEWANGQTTGAVNFVGGDVTLNPNDRLTLSTRGTVLNLEDLSFNLSGFGTVV